jgi:hypothetical protein
MKTATRVLDFEAPNNGLDSPELPFTLICIQRALVLAEVPGIRCTNQPNGMQCFEYIVGSPVGLFIADITAKARKGEGIPSPRQVLTLFGHCCHSPLPCGAPVSCHNSDQLTTQKTKPDASAS